MTKKIFVLLAFCSVTVFSAQASQRYVQQTFNAVKQSTSALRGANRSLARSQMRVAKSEAALGRIDQKAVLLSNQFEKLDTIIHRVGPSRASYRRTTTSTPTITMKVPPGRQSPATKQSSVLAIQPPIKPTTPRRTPTARIKLSADEASAEISRAGAEFMTLIPKGKIKQGDSHLQVANSLKNDPVFGEMARDHIIWIGKVGDASR